MRRNETDLKEIEDGEVYNTTGRATQDSESLAVCTADHHRTMKSRMLSIPLMSIRQFATTGSSISRTCSTDWWGG